ncbi:MAG: DMT family transporter, partial [Bacteroidota bacterium]
KPTSVDYFTLAFLSLIWGSSYILIKAGLEVFTPLQVATLRLSLAAIVLSPLALRYLPRIPRRRWPLLFLTGLTGTALTSYLFPLAQTRLSSSLTGMLSGLTPLCTFLIAWLFFRRTAGVRQFSGVVLGLLGAIGLAYFAPGGGGDTSNLIFVLVVIFCCFCYATSGNLVAEYFGDTPALAVSASSFFMAGLPTIPYLIYGAGVGETIRVAGTEGWWAFGYVAILAVVSTALCYVIFVKLIQRTGAVFASTVSYVIPVVALGWGIVVGEALSWWQVPAIVLVLIGVFLSKGK